MRGWCSLVRQTFPRCGQCLEVWRFGLWRGQNEGKAASKCGVGSSFNVGDWPQLRGKRADFMLPILPTRPWHTSTIHKARASRIWAELDKAWQFQQQYHTNQPRPTTAWVFILEGKSIQMSIVLEECRRTVGSCSSCRSRSRSRCRPGP